jgi:integrin beta 3
MFDGKAFAGEIIEAVKAHVARALAPVLGRIEMLEAMPQPKNGKDGEAGERGRDGAGLAGAMIGRDGQLLVTLSNGDLLDLGQVNGNDGLGFDDLDVTYDGERTFTFRFVHGERVKEFPFKVPVMIYRGAFREQAYERGDTVTFGGSMWHCNAETADKPEDGVEAWTHAVKRGRDGKSGKDGEKGDPGIPGRAGRDLAQVRADGSAW